MNCLYTICCFVCCFCCPLSCINAVHHMQSPPCHNLSPPHLVQCCQQVVVQPRSLHVCQPVDAKQLKHGPVRGSQQQRALAGSSLSQLRSELSAASQQGGRAGGSTGLCSSKSRKRTDTARSSDTVVGEEQRLDDLLLQTTTSLRRPETIGICRAQTQAGTAVEKCVGAAAKEHASKLTSSVGVPQ